MMWKVAAILRRTAVAVILCGALVGLSGPSAEARVFVGIGIPFYGPGFYPPPVYYPPPPVYYPPPPVVYAPPPPVYNSYRGSAPAGAGQTCDAGPYVCPMERPVASGASCYCPGNGGQRVWGRAN